MKRSAAVMLTFVVAACDDPPAPPQDNTPNILRDGGFTTGGGLPWDDEVVTSKVEPPKPSCDRPEDFGKPECKPAQPTVVERVIVRESHTDTSSGFWNGYLTHMALSNAFSSPSTVEHRHYYEPRSTYVRSYTAPTRPVLSRPSVVVVARPTRVPSTFGTTIARFSSSSAYRTTVTPAPSYGSRTTFTAPAPTVSRGGFGSTGGFSASSSSS